MPSLRQAVVVGDEAIAPFVGHGLRELAAYLEAPLVDAVPAVPTDAGCVVEAGLGADVGPEGYVIEVVERDGRPVVAVTGADAQGLKFGLLDLVRSVQRGEDGWTLPDGFARRTAPHAAVRAMYAHLHWSYNRPYALRSWTEDDWRSYVDLLSHFGVNVLQVWPMLGLMPMPLSAQDEDALQMMARVVDYAHEARGMQVWVGECCNNLASGDHGKPLSERSYFGAELLVDPGTPEGLAAIEESRECLYRLIPNADGYWIIDSDPGKWPDSPSSEFVEVFARNQRLMQRYNTTGARMVYWMHVGWGTGTYEENFEATLRGLSERLEEPWAILLGALPQHWDVVERLGLADKAVWFPYGWVEGEPTPPLTQFSFDVIDGYFAMGRERGISGAMGQAQTPVVQLPKIFYLFERLWAGDTPVDVEAAMRKLDGFLFPEADGVLADAWLAMAGHDAGALAKARSGLEQRLVAGLGQPGPVGGCLFGAPELVAEDLLAQLVIRHEAEEMRDAARREAEPREVQEHMSAYLRVALRWRERHGYVPFGGHKFLYGDYLEPAVEAWNDYYDRLGMMHAYPEVQWVPKARLIEEGEFHWALIDAVLNEVVGQPHARRHR